MARNPAILWPFIIVGIFDAISLLLIYLAPQPPFSIVLAPPIRAFWGEKFLHYPQNFVLLPRLFGYAHIVITAIIGVLMTGLAIGMLKDAKSGNKPAIAFNLIYALKRYFAVLAIWVIMFIIGGLVYRIPRLFASFSNRIIPQVALYLSFLIVVLIQIAFIYAFPALIAEKRKLIQSIRRGFSTTRKYFLATLIFLLLPSLIYIPILILRGKSIGLMNRFFPEVVLIVLGIGIILSVLIDCVVTCSTTVLFLGQEKS